VPGLLKERAPEAPERRPDFGILGAGRVPWLDRTRQSLPGRSMVFSTDLEEALRQSMFLAQTFLDDLLHSSSAVRAVDLSAGGEVQ